MPGRQPEDWGIPLRDAIERWTPRELWERYRQFEEYDIPLTIIGMEDPRIEEAWQLHSRIAEVLFNKLVRGDLVASGIALPLKETSRRRDIRPELWPCLAFRHRFSGVMGSGLEYDQILIREASSVPADVPATSQDAPRPQAALHRAAARAGRPSIMPMIEAEIRRRAASGMIEASLGQEAKALAMWAEQQFTDTHIPKPDSIERKLGRVYKELMRTKRPDK